MTFKNLVTSSSFFFVLALGSQIACLSLTAEAQETQIHDTRFTYQGKLDEWNEPAQRAYDFRFRLFDSSEGERQIGPSLNVEELGLRDGSFAVDLDFGRSPEVDSGLWLEVAVRAIDRGADFITLTPRQRLTETPYAILAQGAEWSLIGVPVHVPRMLSRPVEFEPERIPGSHAAQSAEVPRVAPRALAFNGLDHTIIASTVPGESFSRQIRIGFSDTPNPDPANFSDIEVGVGTLTPQATLHVDQPNVPNDGEAQLITFRNLRGLENATGLRIVDSQVKQTRGRHQALDATTSVEAANQAGQSFAGLASSSGFFGGGNFLGVSGRSVPDELENFGASNTSQGLGGRFVSRPDSTLELDGTGQYFVGGAYGEVGGDIDGNPGGGGAVAGVIGVDSSSGTAPSWAGYFLGRGHFASQVGIGTTQPTRLLDVNGSARVRDLTGGPSNALVTADNGGILHKIELTGNSADVLHGDGTFSPASTSTNDGDWLGAGTGQMRTGTLSDRVAIGTTGSSAKFAVVSGAESPAASINLQTPGSGSSTALNARVSGTTTGTGFGAIVSASASTGSANNTGLRAQADSLGFINEAMEATASGAAFRNTGLATVVTGNPTFNIGIRTEASGGTQALGIFALARNGSLNRAGFFQGDIEVTGMIHNPSDMKLKSGIEDLKGALDILSDLRPRSFRYRREEHSSLMLPEGNHFGLIAQELEPVLPQLVAESPYLPVNMEHWEEAPETYKSINYLELIPLLVAGLQEHQAKLEEKQARIRQLESAQRSLEENLANLQEEVTQVKTVLTRP